MSEDIPALKVQARDEAKAMRARFHSEATPLIYETLSTHLMSLVIEQEYEWGCKPITGCYYPIGSEMDTRMAMRDLARSSYPVALPSIQTEDTPLLFREFEPGDPLVSGPLSTKEPEAGAPESIPQILLVPLLAFDRDGYRLGYGGGYYDRTIEHMDRGGELVTVGIGFSKQLVDRVPREQHDRKLDMILSEHGFVDLNSPA